MVEAGQIRLVGTLDTSDIERGQRRITSQFDNINDSASNTNSNFSRLGGITKGLVTSFAALGTLGAGSMIAIATNAPQTAGAMASIQASSQRLSFAVGEELAPSFEKAAELYADFVDSAGTEGSFANTGINIVGTAVSGIITDIENGITSLQSFGDKLNEVFGGEDGVITNNAGNTPIQYLNQEFLPRIQEEGLLNVAFGGYRDLYESIPSNLRIREEAKLDVRDIYKGAKNVYNNIVGFFEADTMGGNVE